MPPKKILIAGKKEEGEREREREREKERERQATKNQKVVINPNELIYETETD